MKGSSRGEGKLCSLCNPKNVRVLLNTLSVHVDFCPGAVVNQFPIDDALGTIQV